MMAEDSAGGSMGAEVLAHLRELEAKGSPGLAAYVVEAFLRDTTARVSALREAVARGDTDTTYRVAHTLQGSSAMVGAAGMASRCAELSRASRAGTLDGAGTVVEELAEALETVRRAFAGGASPGTAT